MRTFTVFAFTKYWFIQIYFFLMLLSPAINFFQAQAPRRLQTVMAIVLTVLAVFYGFMTNAPIDPSGYNTFNFCTLYFLAGYLRRFPLPVTERRKAMAGLYLMSSLALGMCTVALYVWGLPEFAWRMLFYNNPLVMFSALGLFFFFRGLNIHSRWINTVAASVLAVYLLHAAPHIRPLIWAAVGEVYGRFGLGPATWGILLAMTAAIFAVSLAVDRLRLRLVPPLAEWLSARIPERYRL